MFFNKFNSTRAKNEGTEKAVPSVHTDHLITIFINTPASTKGLLFPSLHKIKPWDV